MCGSFAGLVFFVGGGAPRGAPVVVLHGAPTASATDVVGGLCRGCPFQDFSELL